MEQGCRVWKYGDNVDTDVIVPARYLTTSDPVELAAHCMEDIDPRFAAGVLRGDIIVAGENFGCGSSREHAPVAIKASGAHASSRRACAHILPQRHQHRPSDTRMPASRRGNPKRDRLTVDFESGEIRNLSRGARYRAVPFPPFVRNIMTAGGLIPYIRGKLLKPGAHLGVGQGGD